MYRYLISNIDVDIDVDIDDEDDDEDDYLLVTTCYITVSPSAVSTVVANFLIHFFH